MQLGNAVMQAVLSPLGAVPPSAEEMERARQVQARLLCRKTPRLSHLEYGGCYLPACGISGDYYDFLHLGLGRLGLALGDISGKGIPAALMMASLQAILRSHAAMLADDLRRLLRAVNRVFRECTDESCFASLFWGDYDDATRVLRYVNCGHNPPLLVDGDSSATWLEATATVLGVFHDWNCSVREVALMPGDILLLFTDGVTEAMNASGEEFGEGRLLDALRKNRRLALPSLVRELSSSLREFCGNCLRDDATLLVARPIATC
jgi:serine phosphatase RsbU (regulator of sigma subunit)